MAQDVESARGGDLGRKRSRVLGIEQAERRLQPPVGDTGLGVKPGEIEDAHAGCLATRAGGRGNGDERLERSRYWQAFANRRVHVIEEVCRRMRRVEVGRLG